MYTYTLTYISTTYIYIIWFKKSLWIVLQKIQIYEHTYYSIYGRIRYIEAYSDYIIQVAAQHWPRLADQWH